LRADRAALAQDAQGAAWCWQSVPTLPPYDEVIALGHRLVGRAIGAPEYDRPAVAADIAAARFLDAAPAITELPEGCIVLVQPNQDDSLSIVSILDEEASRRGRDFTRLSRDPDEDGMIHYWATGLDPAIAALRQACRLADKQRVPRCRARSPAAASCWPASSPISRCRATTRSTTSSWSANRSSAA